MQFDLIIPTRGDLKTLTPLVKSLNIQTVLPERIFIIIDREFTGPEREQWGKDACGIASDELTKRLMPVSNMTHPFLPGRGASYLRNYGIALAQSDYLYLLDDDNVLDADFFEKTLEEFEGVPPESLYSPAIGWRQTQRIQSYGIRQFHYFLSRPEPMQGGRKAQLFGGLCNFFRSKQRDDHFYYPKMIGANSLFGKTSHFQKLRFDERIPFIFEDVDFTHRRERTVGLIVVSKANIIHHMERDKTKLEHSFVANTYGAYQKAKNRILFVQNNGNARQKVQFYTFGLWFNTLWFSIFILLNAKEKIQTLRALWRGVVDGLQS